MRWFLVGMFPVAVWLGVLMQSHITVTTPVSKYEWTGPWYDAAPAQKGDGDE